MNDLFNQKNKKTTPEYNAKDIVVLEGLEPVRKRPGMYIGGTDINALHHLVNEVLDNSMDEAIAGYASVIEVHILGNGFIKIKDNGRGIPIDPHPKHPKKSALEVILTTLHAGGKFNDNVYKTSGGMNGVGISVVNALSQELKVSIYKNKKLYSQEYQYGKPVTTLSSRELKNNITGTIIEFKPDAQIFPETKFDPKRLFQLVKSKAYLFKGIQIQWKCDKELLSNIDIPADSKLHYPGGLIDFLTEDMEDSSAIIKQAFHGNTNIIDDNQKIEWAITWTKNGENKIFSYCNAIPTPLGGSHENGFKNAILKSIRNYAELSNFKKPSQIIIDDIISSCYLLLTIFVTNPQFQGQTKEKLVDNRVARAIENVIKDYFDLWLSNNKQEANILLNQIIFNCQERLSRKIQTETNRKTFTQKLRLPGKLSDCSQKTAKGTEIFLVEGDSAGGSAKQARARETQAILPLRGKILNVANSSADKINANQEISDLKLALGCGTGNNFNLQNLRYEKVIIMTDADVDGAHIASLLMTFFYKQMPELIKAGCLYIAQPPLYKISCGNKSYYALNDQEKEKILQKIGKNNKYEISRFKGLGEMPAKQLKETTMSVGNRKLIKICLAEDITHSEQQVEKLMGKKPELRFQFIQERSKLLDDKTRQELNT